MKTYRRIYVPMSLDEFEALQQMAERDTRPPRDQARFLLRQILLGHHLVTENTPDAPTKNEPAITIG